MKKLNYMLTALGLGWMLQVSALGVAPMLVYFHAGTNVQDITVSNTDQQVEYTEVTPLYLPNIGGAQVQPVAFNDGANPQSFGLMISPTKVALQPQTSRKIRVVNLLNNVPEDRVYTLTVSDINPAQTVVSKSSGATAQMTMSYGYKVRVFVFPNNPLPIVSAKRVGSTVTITNTGNSYISLRSGQLCDTHGNHCAELSDDLEYHVLYAGNTWTYTLPTPGVVKYNGVYAETKNMAVESN